MCLPLFCPPVVREAEWAGVRFLAVNGWARPSSGSGDGFPSSRERVHKNRTRREETKQIIGGPGSVPAAPAQ
jgi:hypothetical protein